MPDTTTITLPLTTPITAYGETLQKLELRHPTIKELRECGMPYKLGDGSISVDCEAVAKLLSRICNVPPSSIDLMHIADFDEAALRLVGFTKRAPVTAPDTSSGSTS